MPHIALGWELGNLHTLPQMNWVSFPEFGSAPTIMAPLAQLGHNLLCTHLAPCSTGTPPGRTEPCNPGSPGPAEKVLRPLVDGMRWHREPGLHLEGMGLNG